MVNDPLKIQDEQLRQWSREFPYPPTPDIAGSPAWNLGGETRPRRGLRPQVIWAAALLLLLSMLAVPVVHAQVLEFLQIGGIRIFLGDPTTTPETPPTEISGRAIGTATPFPAAAVYPSIDNLTGETRLEAARRELDFSFQLPTYPADVGVPDRIFLQSLGGPAVLLIWLDPVQPERIRLNLLILGPGTFAQKGAPSVIAETSVNGQPAIWTEGPHFLQLGDITYQTVTLVVRGNILIWEQDGLTYRLETDLPLAEAVKIAESLQPVE